MAQDFIEDVSLVVNGQEHIGWQGVTVNVAIDAIARTFSLQMAYNQRGDFPSIALDSPCQIKINDFQILTGFIDTVQVEKDAFNHSIIVQGRSKSRDLIDSSIILANKSNQLNDCTPFQIVEKLSGPFGMCVINDAPDQKKIPIFRWADGAKAGTVMRDACRQQGLTLREDENGCLRVSRPPNGVSRGALREASGGKNLADGNIEGYRIKRSVVDRHSEYIVKGRSTRQDGKSGTQKIGRALDEAVNQYRPLIVRAEGDVTNAICKQRALHEALKRIAISFPARITLSGWRHARDGEPWRVDETVDVYLPEENYNHVGMLIRSISFVKGKTGTRTRLEIVHPDAYSADPTRGLGRAKRTKKLISFIPTGTNATIAGDLGDTSIVEG